MIQLRYAYLRGDSLTSPVHAGSVTASPCNATTSHEHSSTKTKPDIVVDRFPIVKHPLPPSPSTPCPHLRSPPCTSPYCLSGEPLLLETPTPLPTKKTPEGLGPRDSQQATAGASCPAASIFLQSFEMKGIDKQHNLDDSDSLSIFTDAASLSDLDEERSSKYWSIPALTLSEFEQSDTRTATEPRGTTLASPGSPCLPAELEGDCIQILPPKEVGQVSNTSIPSLPPDSPSLPPDFLRMAFYQYPQARQKGEPDSQYLERVKGEVTQLTMDVFETLIDQLAPDWEPKASLSRELGNFQFQLGLLLGKCEYAKSIVDRLNDEHRLNDEVKIAILSTVHNGIASELEGFPVLIGKCMHGFPSVCVCC